MNHIPMANIYAEDSLPNGPFKDRVFDRFRRSNELRMSGAINIYETLDEEYPEVRAWYDSLEK